MLMGDEKRIAATTRNAHRYHCNDMAQAIP